MRVWLLEDQPEYESTTRHGVYADPGRAWDDLLALMDRYVFHVAHRGHFELYVGADPDADRPSDPDRAILLRVRYDGHDEIRLVGEHVRGADANLAPTLEDWRGLQQVGTLLAEHATEVADFRTGERGDPLPTGTWQFYRNA